MDPSVWHLGLMGKVSTGYPLVDFALCLLLPALIRFVSSATGRWLERHGTWERLQHLLKLRSGGSVCVRHISHTTTPSRFFYSHDPDEKCNNAILQRAILMYMDSLPGVSERYRTAEVLLQAPIEGVEGRTDREEDVPGRLARHSVVTAPPLGHWVSIRKGPCGDIDFKRTCTTLPDGEAGSVKQREIDFWVRAKSDGSGAEAMVTSFLRDAYQFYVNKAMERRDGHRYMYMPLMEAPRCDPGDPCVSRHQLYKQYPLSEARTFESGLFHPDSSTLLALVNNFMMGTGKFAVPGFPRKLGLLLHGPPGTGKTTLIKVIAQHLGRHIVTVPLSAVRTNQQLMDIMFDPQFHVTGQEVPVTIPLSKIVFVMEDIDAASSVVGRRGDKPDEATQVPDGYVATGEKPKVVVEDALNLAGVLNALDGILDCDDRVVIMTTNHPDQLDPALVRPGRVNRKVHMGCMTEADCLRMVEHYFPDTAQSELELLRASVRKGPGMTPAHVEMLCGCSDTVADIVRQIG